MSTVIGIDPGQEKSAVVQWCGDSMGIGFAKEMRNEDLANFLKQWGGPLAIEWIRGYGLQVGNETFDTVYWTGRFVQAYLFNAGTNHKPSLIERKAVLENICNNRKAKDSHLRQAIIDRCGVQGTKKKPGPLYEISGTHLFSALGVALTWWDQHNGAPA